MQRYYNYIHAPLAFYLTLWSHQPYYHWLPTLTLASDFLPLWTETELEFRWLKFRASLTYIHNNAL